MYTYEEFEKLVIQKLYDSYKVLFPYDMTFEEYESWYEFFGETEFILYWR